VNAVERESITGLITDYMKIAGDLVSGMSSTFTKLDVTNVKVLSLAELQMVFDERNKLSSSRLTATNQSFMGDLNGESTLLVDEHSALSLYSHFNDSYIEDQSKYNVLDILSELNNLISAGCTRYLADLFKLNIEFSRPHLDFLTTTRLDFNRQHLSEGSRVILINVELDFKEDLIWGTWYLWLESSSYSILRRALSLFGKE